MTSVTAAGSGNTENSARTPVQGASISESANPTVALVRSAVEFLFENGKRDPARPVEEHIMSDLKNTFQKQRSYQQVWRDCWTLFSSRLEASAIMRYATLHGVDFIQVTDVSSNDEGFERSVSSELSVTPKDEALLHKVAISFHELGLKEEDSLTT